MRSSGDIFHKEDPEESASLETLKTCLGMTLSYVLQVLCWVGVALAELHSSILAIPVVLHWFQKDSKAILLCPTL